MPGLVVKPRARILHGHDWVFSSEVLKVFGKPADGDVISLKDGRDHLIGSAIYNSRSQIVARRFSRRKQDLDHEQYFVFFFFYLGHDRIARRPLAARHHGPSRQVHSCL